MNRQTLIVLLVVAVVAYLVFKKLTIRVYSDFPIINQVGGLPKDYSVSALMSKPKSAEQKPIRIKVLIS